MIRNHTQTVTEVKLQLASASSKLTGGEVPTTAATPVNGLESEAVPQEQWRQEGRTALQHFLCFVSHYTHEKFCSIQFTRL
jgi:hypothetical protein